ncbi:MAG: hypothetical protein P8186_10495, partial [Anaerolineae bacterium]
MQQRKDVSRQSLTEAPRSSRMSWHPLPLPFLVAVAGLALVTLACAFLESAVPIAPTAIATRTPLPTFTPMIAGTSLATAMPEQPPAASPTPALSPTSLPVPVAAAPASPTLAPPPASAPTVASVPSETSSQTPAAVPAPIPTDTPAAS